MEPNIIELDETGIFCYGAPEIDTCYPKDCIEETPVHFLNSENRYVCTCRIKEAEALEAAKRDRVYFEVDDPRHTKFALTKAYGVIQVGKQYPIPDGYGVKIIEDSAYTCVAILVPKEKVMEPHIDKYGDMRYGKFETVKQQSIEEATTKYSLEWVLEQQDTAFYSFIAGAKSQAAKEYWYEQFKQEKL